MPSYEKLRNLNLTYPIVEGNHIIMQITCQENTKVFRLTRVNSLMDYIPCAAQSLNLVGVHSVGCCLDAVNFFGFLQVLYNFASASTSRWKVVMSNINDEKQKEEDKTAQKLTIKEPLWNTLVKLCCCHQYGFTKLSSHLESLEAAPH